MGQNEEIFLQGYERTRRELLEMEEREQKIVELFKLLLRRSLVYIEKSNPELSSCCHTIRTIANKHQSSDFPLERMQAAIDELSNGIMRSESGVSPSIAVAKQPTFPKKSSNLTVEDPTEAIREILKGLSKFAPMERASIKLIEAIEHREFDGDSSILIRRVIDLIAIKLQSLIDERHHLFQIIGFVQKNIPSDLMELVDDGGFEYERNDKNDRLLRGIDEDFDQLKSMVLDAEDIKSIKQDVLVRFASMHENIKKFHANEKQVIDKLRDQNNKYKSIFVAMMQKVQGQNGLSAPSSGNPDICPITGLPTEVLYRKKLKSALERARPGSPPMTLMIFDTQNLGEQIKSLGDVAANKILVVFVQEVSKNIRYSDYFSRIGEEHFAILLMSCSGSDGLKIAEKILSQINGLRIQSGSVKTKITLSCGLTEISYGMTHEEIHAHTLENLQTALKLGGNRCVLRNFSPIS